ncbi:hypothetical protein HPB52_003636 [Rhipicephalus sanguineus]|uniref:THAP-type domain-containing protein n=1 Tax=Rhipicephalus sanguineus TaxID=34632 RepID=A0A9D4SMY0_RHISA|nr:hypothetical protein HPB52_003636 [Rhipicephalus sanguineus]
MFRFPANPGRRRLWLAQVKRDDWEPTSASRICSDHFKDSAYELRRQDGLKKLRPDAVPTVFPVRGVLEQPEPLEMYSSPVLPPWHAHPAATLQSTQPVSDSARAQVLAPPDFSCNPVVLSLAEELLSLRGYKYLLTSRLIQDCLENVFSIVRMKKPVPSAYDVKFSLKLICVGQFLHTPKSSSYDSVDGLHLADLLGASLEKSLEEFINDEVHLQNLTLDEVSSVECDILAYVGGFLLKTIIKAIGECPPCTAVLLGDGQCYNALIELKEYVKGATNLLRPSAAVMELLVHNEEHFKGFVAEDAILDLKAPFRTISSLILSRPPMLMGACGGVDLSRGTVCGEDDEVRLKLSFEVESTEWDESGPDVACW